MVRKDKPQILREWDWLMDKANLPTTEEVFNDLEGGLDDLGRESGIPSPQEMQDKISRDVKNIIRR